MSVTRTLALVAVAIGMLSAPMAALAQQATEGAQAEIQAAEQRARALEEIRAQHEKALKALGEKVKASGGKEAYVAEARKALELAREQATNARNLVRQYLSAGVRAVPFGKPVTLSVKDATVREAAEALGKAAGIAIAVEDAARSDKKLSIEAENVPLGTLLEILANQAGMMIAPARDGVALKRWPTLKVNGKEESFRGRIAPWSDEWGTPPTLSGRAGVPSIRELPLGGTIGGFGAGGGLLGPLGGLKSEGGLAAPAVPAPPAGRAGPAPRPPMINVPPVVSGGRVRVGAPTTATVFGGMLGDSPVAMTSLGDRTVVTAHVGQSADGKEWGIWLTVYRLEGNELKKQSSTFQKLEGVPQGRRMLFPFGSPGVDGFQFAPDLFKGFDILKKKALEPLPAPGVKAPVKPPAPGGAPDKGPSPPAPPPVPEKDPAS